LDSFRGSRKVEIIPVALGRPDVSYGPDVLRVRDWLWQRYARGVAERLHKGPEDVAWRADHEGSLWVRGQVGDQGYWVVLRALKAASRLSWPTLLVFTLIVLLALIGGWLLQRRINRPLRRLSQAAGALAQGRQPRPIPEEAPEEIAIVTRAFNQMIGGL